MRQADIAMYQGKTSGEDVVFFEPAMQSELVVRQELESDLRRAVSERELGIAFQPLVDLASGRIYGVEALARWHHPTRGEIAPNVFIPIAEEIGVIVELDRLVWSMACREAASWRSSDGRPSIQLSLNLSARHLLAADLTDVLADILRAADIDPADITLEITETQLMLDLPSAIEQMWSLRDLGVQLAIDDFGTGYSSLAYLQQLPVETLKIDRGFVAGLDGEPKAAQLVRAMVNLAHGFGLRVVAEGVETTKEAAALRAMGADVGQGYLFARPVGPEALRLLLERGQLSLGTAATGH